MVSAKWGIGNNRYPWYRDICYVHFTGVKKNLEQTLLMQIYINRHFHQRFLYFAENISTECTPSPRISCQRVFQKFRTPFSFHFFIQLSCTFCLVSFGWHSWPKNHKKYKMRYVFLFSLTLYYWKTNGTAEMCWRKIIQQPPGPTKTISWRYCFSWQCMFRAMLESLANCVLRNNTKNTTWIIICRTLRKQLFLLLWVLKCEVPVQDTHRRPSLKPI